MRVLLAILCLMMVSTPMHSNDDCVRALPEPIVITSHLDLSHYELKKQDSRHIEEVIQLKTGRKVIIAQYGCVHFGLSYKFLMDKEFVGSEISLAEKLLGEVSNVAPTFTQTLIAKLSEISEDYPTPEMVTFEVGYDLMHLKFEEVAGQTHFVISYDIAL